MNIYLYAALCVVVPLAWGVAVVAIGGRVERLIARWRGRRGKDDRLPPPVDYSI